MKSCSPGLSPHQCPSRSSPGFFASKAPRNRGKSAPSEISPAAESLAYGSPHCGRRWKPHGQAHVPKSRRLYERQRRRNPPARSLCLAEEPSRCQTIPPGSQGLSAPPHTAPDGQVQVENPRPPRSGQHTPCAKGAPQRGTPQANSAFPPASVPAGQKDRAGFPPTAARLRETPEAGPGALPKLGSKPLQAPLSFGFFPTAAGHSVYNEACIQFLLHGNQLPS